MRGLGKFQIMQMKAGDPRVPQLFRIIRQGLDLLEEISLHPHKEPASPDVPAPPTVQLVASTEMPSKKLAYSIKEVRALTGISNAKIYTEIKKKRLRRSKVGGRTLVLATDLQAWMNGWARK